MKHKFVLEILKRINEQRMSKVVSLFNNIDNIGTVIQLGSFEKSGLIALTAALSECQNMEELVLNDISLPHLFPERELFELFLTLLAQHPKLKILRFRWCNLDQLDDNGFEMFSKLLKQHPELEELDLGENKLETLNTGKWITLGNIFSQSSRLTTIRLNGNNLSNLKQPC